MTSASELRSGKGHRDENFPVASWIIHPRHRALILAFYNFVRTADDIADHATLAAKDKLALLDLLEDFAGVLVELLDLRHMARPFRRIDDVLLHDRPDPFRGRIDVDFLSQPRHPAIINRVSDAGSPARPARSRGLGALRHRNYRLFVSGQIISTVGTWTG